MLLPVLLVAITPTAPTAAGPSSTATSVTDGVVMVEPLRPGMEPPTAAVVVSAGGLVVAPVDRLGQRKRLTLYVAPSEGRSGMVVYRDEQLGLALISTEESLPNIRAVPLASNLVTAVGTRLTTRGVEGGLPWQSGSAVVVNTGTGPWGQMARGYLVCDGQNEGTAVNAGAAVVGPDGRLVGIHLGRLRVTGAPPNRFVVAGVELLRTFLDQATVGMPLAQVRVTASIRGASVLLDGAVVGATPLTVPNVTVGWHSLRVAAPGQTSHERLLHVGLHEPTLVHAELRPAAALKFSADAEDAQVSLDGAPALPLAAEPIPVPQGYHRASIWAPGHRVHSWAGSVQPGELLPVEVALVKEHGLLSVHSDPGGAAVLVDGRKAGFTPLTAVKLRPGVRHVEVRLDRYRVARLEPVSMADGQSVDLGTIKLVPLPARLMLAPDVAESDDQVFLDGQPVAGHAWKVEPGYHDIEVRRPWHTPGKLRVLVSPGEERSVAPRPEALPQRGERRFKILGAGSGMGVAALGVVSVLGLVGGGIALLAGGAFAYNRYHLATTQPLMEINYRLAHLLLWSGLGALLLTLAPVLAGTVGTGTAVLALLTLPSDPSTKAAAKGERP